MPPQATAGWLAARGAGRRERFEPGARRRAPLQPAPTADATRGEIQSPIIRRVAFEELQAEEQRIGANAVVGIDLDYEVVGQNGSMLMVSVSGTAIVVV